MKYRGQPLSDFARETADLLQRYMSESDMANALLTTYERGLEKAGLQSLPTPQKLLPRIELEILCFAVVLIMVQEVAKILPKTRTFRLGRVPDVDAIECYNHELMEVVHKSNQVEDTDEKTTTVADRLSSYSSLSSVPDAADEFARSVAASAPEGGYAVMKIVAQRYIDPIVAMSQMVVRRTFHDG